MGIQKLIKDKRGLEFKSAFFALIAVSMVIIAVGVIINDWNLKYHSGLNYDLGNYNKLNSVSDEATSQQTGINVKSTDTGENFEGTSIRGVWGILNNIYAPFRVVFGDGGMLDAVTERFGMPDYIRQGLVAMMIMAITFTLVAIFFRLSRSTT